LEAFGTSDALYGASSASVIYMTRPETCAWGNIWSINPSIQLDGTDADVYFRWIENVRVWLDFSTGEQLACCCPIVSSDTVFMPSMSDDFWGGSTETGEVGGVGWSFSNGSIVLTASEQNHPGVIIRRSGTSANQVASLYLSSTTNTVFRFDEFKYCTFVLSNVTTGSDFRIRAGLTVDAASETPANAIYLERLHGDTNWFVVTRASSSETRTDTGIAMSNGWIRVNIRRISHGNILFELNGYKTVSHTTNIMAASTNVAPFAHIVPTTTSARDMKIDYFSLSLKPVMR